MVKNSKGKQKHCTLRKRLSEVGFFLWFFRPSVLLLRTCQVCKKSCTLSRKVQKEYFSFQQPTKSRVHGRTEVTTSRPHTLQTSQTNMYITSLFSVSPFENPRGWKEAVNHTRAPAEWPQTWRWKKKLWETSKTWRLLWEKETETLNAQKEERSSTTPICSYTTVQNQYKDKDARQDINWSSLWNKTYYVLNIFMCLQPRGTSVGWNTDVNAATLSQLKLFEPDK